MPNLAAYAIGQISIRDEVLWREYLIRLPATLEPWGGEVILRGRRCELFSGATEKIDSVVLRFFDTEAMRGWFFSPAYQALIPLRDQAADVLLVGYEVQAPS